MKRELIEKVMEEAKGDAAELVIWDRRDTFTVKSEGVSGIELSDGYLKVDMEDGKATVYVEYDQIYKLVVARERKAGAGIRAGFGTASN